MGYIERKTHRGLLEILKSVDFDGVWRRLFYIFPTEERDRVKEVQRKPGQLILLPQNNVTPHMWRRAMYKEVCGCHPTIWMEGNANRCKRPVEWLHLRLQSCIELVCYNVCSCLECHDNYRPCAPSSIYNLCVCYPLQTCSYRVKRLRPSSVNDRDVMASDPSCKRIIQVCANLS